MVWYLTVDVYWSLTFRLISVQRSLTLRTFWNWKRGWSCRNWTNHICRHRNFCWFYWYNLNVNFCLRPRRKDWSTLDLNHRRHTKDFYSNRLNSYLRLCFQINYSFKGTFNFIFQDIEFNIESFWPNFTRILNINVYFMHVWG